MPRLRAARARAAGARPGSISRPKPGEPAWAPRAPEEDSPHPRPVPSSREPDKPRPPASGVLLTEEDEKNATPSGPPVTPPADTASCEGVCEIVPPRWETGEKFLEASAAHAATDRRWMNKTWSIPTMDYYSALKRKATLTPAVTWMNLKDAALSEMSRSRRTNATCLHFREVPGAPKLETDSRTESTGIGGANGGFTPNGDRVSVWEAEDVLEVAAAVQCLMPLNYLHTQKWLRRKFCVKCLLPRKTFFTI